MISLSRFFGAALFAATLLAAGTASAVLVTDPTTSWTAIQYNGIFPDFFTDEQSTSRDRDIVGDANHPAFYKAFNFGDPVLLTDGQILFRLRVAGDKNPAGFEGAAFVGIDLDGNGTLDLFAGVDRSGGTSIVGVWIAGTGANISPSTTTLVSTPAWSQATSATNYSFVPVTSTNDPIPSPLNTNLDGGSGGGGDHNDYFLSFGIDFQQLVNVAVSRGFNTFNENSAMRFVAATATQANSLNSDLNGVNGGTSSTTTWTALGAITLTYTSGGITPIPEPPVASSICWGAVLLLLRRRKAK